MLGPYRDTVTVDAPLLLEPLPDRCIPLPQGCSHPSPPAVAPAIRPGPSLPPFFAKALAASASILLLSASGFFATGAWINASSYLAARVVPVKAPAPAGTEKAAKVATRPPPRPPAPKRAMPLLPGPRPMPPSPWAPAMSGVSPVSLGGSPVWSVLAAMGRPTHDVETLWQRARSSGAFTVARASVARGAVEPVDPLYWVQQPGWLEVTGTPRWPTALAGVRRGDRILAINGFPVRGSDGAAFGNVALGGNALVELIRDGKLVALRIDWVP
jgi:hypothetical protein